MWQAIFLICVVGLLWVRIALGEEFRNFTVRWSPVTTLSTGETVSDDIVSYEVIICRGQITDDGKCDLGFYRQEIPAHSEEVAFVFHYDIDPHVCVRIRALIKGVPGEYSGHACLMPEKLRIPSQVKDVSITIKD